MLLESQEYQTISANNNSILSYKGPITSIIISEMGTAIRKYFSDNARLSRKVFSVFMELTQNMYFYSSEKMTFEEEKENRIGTFVITAKDDYYTFSSSNLVSVSLAEVLADHCETINSLDREALRKYKREQRDQPAENNSKGAGIGLIQVALLVNAPLNIHFEEYDQEYTYFVVSVKIEK